MCCIPWWQAAFRNAQIGPHHFAGSTGYGHGDLGRAALDKVAAAICPLHTDAPPAPPLLPLICSFART